MGAQRLWTSTRFTRLPFGQTPSTRFLFRWRFGHRIGLDIKVRYDASAVSQSPDDHRQSVLPALSFPLDGDLSGPKRLSALEEQVRRHGPVPNLFGAGRWTTTTNNALQKI